MIIVTLVFTKLFSGSCCCMWAASACRHIPKMMAIGSMNISKARIKTVATGLLRTKVLREVLRIILD